MEPDYVEAYHNLGAVYLELNRLNEAIEELLCKKDMHAK